MLLFLISFLVVVSGEPLKEAPIHNGQPFTADTFFNTLDDPTIQTLLSIIGVEDCFVSSFSPKITDVSKRAEFTRSGLYVSYVPLLRG